MRKKLPLLVLCLCLGGCPPTQTKPPQPEAKYKVGDSVYYAHFLVNKEVGVIMETASTQFEGTTYYKYGVKFRDESIKAYVIIWLDEKDLGKVIPDDR